MLDELDVLRLVIVLHEELLRDDDVESELAELLLVVAGELLLLSSAPHDATGALRSSSQ